MKSKQGVWKKVSESEETEMPNTKTDVEQVEDPSRDANNRAEHGDSDKRKGYGKKRGGAYSKKGHHASSQLQVDSGEGKAGPQYAHGKYKGGKEHQWTSRKLAKGTASKDLGDADDKKSSPVSSRKSSIRTAPAGASTADSSTSKNEGSAWARVKDSFVLRAESKSKATQNNRMKKTLATIPEDGEVVQQSASSSSAAASSGEGLQEGTASPAEKEMKGGTKNKKSHYSSSKNDSASSSMWKARAKGSWKKDHGGKAVGHKDFYYDNYHSYYNQKDNYRRYTHGKHEAWSGEPHSPSEEKKSSKGGAMKSKSEGWWTRRDDFGTSAKDYSKAASKECKGGKFNRKQYEFHEHEEDLHDSGDEVDAAEDGSSSSQVLPDIIQGRWKLVLEENSTEKLDSASDQIDQFPVAEDHIATATDNPDLVPGTTVGNAFASPDLCSLVPSTTISGTNDMLLDSTNTNSTLSSPPTTASDPRTAMLLDATSSLLEFREGASFLDLVQPLDMGNLLDNPLSGSPFPPGHQFTFSPREEVRAKTPQLQSPEMVRNNTVPVLVSTPFAEPATMPFADGEDLATSEGVVPTASTSKTPDKIDMLMNGGRIDRQQNVTSLADLIIGRAQTPQKAFPFNPEAAAFVPKEASYQGPIATDDDIQRFFGSSSSDGDSCEEDNSDEENETANTTVPVDCTTTSVLLQTPVKPSKNNTNGGPCGAVADDGHVELTGAGLGSSDLGSSVADGNFASGPPGPDDVAVLGSSNTGNTSGHLYNNHGGYTYNPLEASSATASTLEGSSALLNTMDQTGISDLTTPQCTSLLDCSLDVSLVVPPSSVATPALPEVPSLTADQFSANVSSLLASPVDDQSFIQQGDIYAPAAQLSEAPMDGGLLGNQEDAPADGQGGLFPHLAGYLKDVALPFNLDAYSDTDSSDDGYAPFHTPSAAEKDEAPPSETSLEDKEDNPVQNDDEEIQSERTEEINSAEDAADDESCKDMEATSTSVERLVEADSEETTSIEKISEAEEETAGEEEKSAANWDIVLCREGTLAAADRVEIRQLCEYFADDGDSRLLVEDYLGLRCNSAQDITQHLLCLGADDYRRADLVKRTLAALVKERVLRWQPDIFSEIKQFRIAFLEYFELDNPKVGDYLTEVATELATVEEKLMNPRVDDLTLSSSDSEETGSSLRAETPDLLLDSPLLATSGSEQFTPAKSSSLDESGMISRSISRSDSERLSTPAKSLSSQSVQSTPEKLPKQQPVFSEVALKFRTYTRTEMLQFQPVFNKKPQPNVRPWTTKLYEDLDNEKRGNASGSGAWRSSRGEQGTGSKLSGSKPVSSATKKQEIQKLMKASSNSWMKTQGSHYASDSVACWERKIQGLLNKITFEKFESVTTNLLELLETHEDVSVGIPKLIAMVFQIATTQHHFVQLYTQLCQRIHNWLCAKNMPEQGTLKRTLLNQCQASFEEYLSPELEFEGLKHEELYEAELKYKTKMLGNIKFVGELIRAKMIASRIAICICQDLIENGRKILPAEQEGGEANSTNKAAKTAAEKNTATANLETLVAFVESIGPMLDNQSWPHWTHFDEVLQVVAQLSTDKAVPARIRCLLQDVVDLRASQWVNQKKAKSKLEKATTLKEVNHAADGDSKSKTTGGGASSQKQQRPSSAKKDSSSGNAGSKPSSVGSTAATTDSLLATTSVWQMTVLIDRKVEVASDPDFLTNGINNASPSSSSSPSTKASPSKNAKKTSSKSNKSPTLSPRSELLSSRGYDNLCELEQSLNSAFERVAKDAMAGGVRRAEESLPSLAQCFYAMYRRLIPKNESLAVELLAVFLRKILVTEVQKTSSPGLRGVWWRFVCRLCVAGLFGGNKTCSYDEMVNRALDRLKLSKKESQLVENELFPVLDECFYNHVEEQQHQ
ncbi:unnamed protein product [Amoebophrya sp. A120]|nr:unnamed protein product [Amoebophrya sp. A120]|eukprot:GSA120T00011668001.1